MIKKAWSILDGLSVLTIAEGRDGVHHLLKDNVIIPMTGLYYGCTTLEQVTAVAESRYVETGMEEITL